MGKNLLKALQAILFFLCISVKLFAQADDLMLVEYVDWRPGSGVGVKIYNPTGTAIDLSSYKVEVYYNGNTSATGNYALTGSLAAKSTVITGNTPFCNSNCSSTCDITYSNAGVNGNDVIVLRKGTTIVDMMGLIGYNPGSSGWRVDNTSNALKWHKVTRNSDNCTRYTSTTGSGTNSWPNSSNTNVTGWTVSNTSCISQGFTLKVSTATPKINMPSKDTTVCRGQSISFVANGFYKWLRRSSGGETVISANDSIININFNTSGADTIIVQANSCGVVVEDTIIIIVGAPISINLGNDTNICGTINLILDTKVSGANYTWQNNSTAPTFNVKDTGLYWVNVTKDGCSTTDSIKVASKAGNSVNLGADTTLCSGDSLELSYTCTGCTYLWSDNSTNNKLLVRNTGTYWLEATTGGCQARDSIKVSFTTQPTFSLGKDTSLCVGDSIVLNSPANVTRLWEDNSTDSSRTIKTTGTYSLQVTDANTCTNSDTVSITFNPIPFFSLGADTNLCQSAVIVLRKPANNPAQVLWSTAATTDSIAVSVAQTYWAKLTANNCSYTDSINVLPAPTYTKQLLDTTMCLGQTVLLNASTNGATYKWSDGSTFPTLIVDTVGTYKVDITISGCEFSDSAFVALETKPQPPNLNDSTVCEDASVTINATTNASTYLWNNGATTPALTLDSGGLYIVQATNKCGLVTDSANITVEVCQPPFIPNVFTPNGDGINDFFYIDFNVVNSFQVEIFNRWGEQVYKSDDPKFSWDGRYKNQLVPAGVYFYVVTSKVGIGKAFNASGSLTIYR